MPTASVPALLDRGEPRVRRPSWLRRLTPAVIFWLTFIVLLTLTLIRNSYVFTRRVYEGGDFALNSFLVNHTHTSVQLVGPYSRLNFPHPGPAYIYVLSAGQALFHGLLHVTPSQYGGQFVGDAVIQSVMLGLVVMSLFRVTNSLTAVAVAAPIIFAFAATHEMIGYVWLPCMYMSAFALLLVSAPAVAAGHTRELPLLVVAGGFLVQGHVAFILFVVVTVAIVTAGWGVAHRSEWRRELRVERAWLRLSAIVVAVFLLPMVLELVLHYPGPWNDYIDYSIRQGKSTHSLTDSLRFVGHFWNTVRVPMGWFVVTGIVGLAAFIFDRNSRRRIYFGWSYGILVLENLLFLYYVIRGVDVLNSRNYYTGYFYETVPLFIMVVAFVHGAMVLHERLAARQPSWEAWPVPIAATMVAFALVLTRATTPGFTDLYRGSDSYPQIVTALKADPDRGGRPVVVDLIQADWGAVAGVIIQADRAGLKACLEDPFWTNYFTPESMCTLTADHWRVAILPRSAWDGKGTTVWSDATLVVVEGAT